MKDNGQYESNYFIIKISHDNVYFIIRQIFFFHKDAQNPFATSNFFAAKNVHNTRENRQRLRHFFFFGDFYYWGISREINNKNKTRYIITRILYSP